VPPVLTFRNSVFFPQYVDLGTNGGYLYLQL